MDNRVGDNVPSAAKLAGLLKQLQDVIAQLQKFGVVLSKAERRRALRVRRDSEPMQRLVYALAEKRSVSLPGVPLAGMQNDMNLVQLMEPFDAAMRLGQQLTSDTLLQADTEGWQAFLAYYGVLSVMATHDAELAAALQPVVDFMKTGRRQPEPDPEADPDPAATP
jgi:hypothetical protein